MGTTKNIEMREYNRSDYNLLLPKTNSYTKEETLTSYTKSLANLPDDATPDDVFLALIVGLGNKAYRVKVIYPNGLPAVGYTVTGLTALPNFNLITNNQGIVIGKSSLSSPTIRVSKKYDDVNAFSSSFSSVGTITDIIITLSWNETAFTVSETKTITPLLSPFATNLVFLMVGRGGTGGIVTNSNNGYFSSGNSTFGGRGGGGGGYYEQGSYPLKDIEQLVFTVGNGGVITHRSGNVVIPANGEPSSISFLKNNITTLIKSVDGGKHGNQGYENLINGYPYDSDMHGGTGGLGGKKGRNGGNAFRQGSFDNDDNIGKPSYTYGAKGENSESVSFYDLNLTISGGGSGGDGGYESDYSYYGGSKRSDNNSIGGGGGGEGAWQGNNTNLPRNGQNGCIWYAFTH